MALGAVDVAKEKGLFGKMVIFGNDGEKDALASIEAGELTGTQYTDVVQGRYVAAATVLATGLCPCRCSRSAGQGADALPDRHRRKRRADSTQPALVIRCRKCLLGAIIRDGRN